METDPLVNCLKIAKEAGVPKDQVEKFLNVGYVPLPWQWSFHALARTADNENGPVDIGAGGARGPGKSHVVLAQAGLDDCQRINNLKGLFLRQTGISAQESFDDLVNKVLFKKVEYKKTGTILRFPNGSRIVLGGFQNERDIDKYIGIEYDFIIVEELNQLSEDKYIKLRGSLRTSKPNWRPRMYTSFNPGGLGHAFVKSRYVTPFREKKETETRFIPSDYKSNPYLNKEYIDYLLGLKGDLGKAWRDGEWDIFAGMIFNEWNHDVHVCHPFTPKPSLTIIGGIDWGYSAPAVLLLGVFMQKEYQGIKFNRLYIYKEIDGNEKTPRDWAKVYKESAPEAYTATIYADPAMFNKLQDSSFSLADQFKREGLYIKKGTNNALNKITNIHNWLSIAPDGEPYMVITENCRNLIRTIPEAMYDDLNPEDKDRNWSEDHWYDSISYMLSGPAVKWIDASSGSIVRPSMRLSDIPKIQIQDKDGNFIGLDPDNFANPYRKGVYYK